MIDFQTRGEYTNASSLEYVGNTHAPDVGALGGADTCDVNELTLPARVAA